MKTLHLKVLLSSCSCFITFFPFRKLQLCLYIGKFGYIYAIGIKTNKKLSQSPLFIKTPSPLFNPLSASVALI